MKKALSSIKINCARRAIHIHNQVSASLNTGSHKLESGYSNGDCLLLDMNNLFFAVSDSTDRRPEASRNFLLRLIEIFSSGNKPANKDECLAAVNSLYSAQDYVDRATFSSLWLQAEGTSRNAVVIHGGDSIILVVDVNEKKIKYQTTSNMNFIGRAKGIPDTEVIPIENENEIIIMGSDGIADIARLSKLTLEDMCIAATARYSIDEVPMRITHLLDSQQEALNHDDIGIIAIDPFNIRAVPGTCILMGGTAPEAEKKYFRYQKNGTIPDKWWDINGEDIPSEILDASGFTLRQAGN